MIYKKGSGVIATIMLFMFFLIIWFVWLGGYINDTGELLVAKNGLVGLEAFFFSNLNIVVFVCMLLGMLGFMYFVTE